MFKSGIQGILNKSRSIMTRNFGTETQGILSSMIYDDEVEVLTTFDMNRVATLTFGDEVCGEIFDVLEYTLRHPIEFTVLTLHKSLVLLRHLAIYASQKAANATWILKPHIQPLTEYNTVLLALDNPKSILGRIQRIKGGNVDRGRPVRDSAQSLFDLLDDVEMFKAIRSQSEDPDSLVPVGDKEEVGFVSDEVRKAMLEDKLRKEQQLQIKSNLKTPNEAIFGGGYISTDGKMVVGAAHGLEEMLKMAERNNGKKGYTDDIHTTNIKNEEKKRHKEHLEKLKHEFQMTNVQSVSSLESGNGNGTSPSTVPIVADLLDFHSDAEPTPEPEIVKSPSLPYPSSREESYIQPQTDHNNNENTTGTGNGASTDDHDDLLSLTTSTYHSTTGVDVMQMQMQNAIGNMTLNSTEHIHNMNPTATTSSATSITNPSVFDDRSSSLLDPIAGSHSLSVSSVSNSVSNISSMPISSEKAIMGMGGSIMQSSNSAATAISSLDMIAPPIKTMDTSTVSPKTNEIPSIPVDLPPPLPPMPTMSPPSDPPLSPPPPPMTYMQPSLGPPTSSPPPMGGSPCIPSSQPSFLPNMNMTHNVAMLNPNAQNSMNMPLAASSTASSNYNNSDNSNTTTTTNSMHQQQEMMKMMMNQQQMMQQGMINGGGGSGSAGNNDQQAKMMQQMMMMNQQMMQQLMSMQNQSQPTGQHQTMSLPMLQQQQQMMMGQPQVKNTGNDIMTSQQNVSNSNENNNNSLGGYSPSTNPFS